MLEMNQEKLIENVRSYEALYVTTHAKYNDIRFKENAWREIGMKIRQPAAVCKKTWTNLRDSFRRTLRKRRELRNAQGVCKIRKWKFEDEMTFLIPHLQDRDSCTNLGKDTDDNNEDEDEEDDQDANNNEDRSYNGDDTGDDDKDADSDDSNFDDNAYAKTFLRTVEPTRRTEMNKNVPRQMTRSKGIQKFESKPVGTQYLLGNNRNNAIVQRHRKLNQESSAIDTFFSSIASTVKSFSPYYQNIAKSRIFNIISDIEMKQIVESQQEQLGLASGLPNATIQCSSHAQIPTTITPDMLESYHAESCDITQSPLSVSPSSISHHFPGSFTSICNNEKFVKKE